MVVTEAEKVTFSPNSGPGCMAGVVADPREATPWRLAYRV